MDEIRELIAAIINLPNLAVYALMGYLFYKLALVASWVALARLAILKAHDWLVHRHTYREVRPVIDKITIGGSGDRLIALLQGLKNVSGKHTTVTEYVWPDDVEWLAQAISEKRLREEEAKK